MLLSHLLNALAVAVTLAAAPTGSPAPALTAPTPALSSAQGQSLSRACADEAFRQFDFWLGSWDVTLPTGKLAGRSAVASILDGCVILESWTSGTGVQGKSFSIYDSSRHVWHQTWVDNGGTLLELEGNRAGARMELTGRGVDEAGRPVVHRISWTPRADDRLRQLWEISSDAGRTWKVAFDGLYTRRQ
jgi:hypothetical protein